MQVPTWDPNLRPEITSKSRAVSIKLTRLALNTAAVCVALNM